MSHELRAPLTSIKGSAAMLETTADLGLAVMRDFFHIIADRSTTCTGSSNDLLDAGRIGAGTL